jgi:aspartate carbamoyltransferase catalytic subunit
MSDRRADTPSLTSRHLLGIEGLQRSEVEAILALARKYKQELKEGTQRTPLVGKWVANLFFEDSTRTRSSFEIAAKSLGAKVLNWSPTGSSLSKGETLLDTVRNIDATLRNIDANGPSALVIRHRSSGAPTLVSRHVHCSVINAGDGIHEHPSQALLDAFTLEERIGSLSGKRVMILGDILHSRVARSNIHCLRLLGAKVFVSGPPTLMPASIESLECEWVPDFHEVLGSLDALMTLRVQRERQTDSFLPSMREYASRWGIGRALETQLKPGAVILHPGPVNRGVELSSEVIDGDRSVILEQVSNGLPVRMAILEMCA